MTQDRDADSRLDEQLARLPREIQPGNDLWSGIEAGIRDRTGQVAGERAADSSWRPSGWESLAAAVLLVVVSSLTTFALMQDKEPVVANVPAWSPQGVGLQFASYPMGAQYLEARRTVSAGVESRLAELEPATRQAVETSLDEIRQAVSELDEALRDDPNNVLLQQLLLATYQDELAVLGNLNLMTRNLAVRTDL